MILVPQEIPEKASIPKIHAIILKTVLNKIDKVSALVEDTEVICSATVSVTGKSYAYGVHFYDGDLTLDNATITAKVTDKANSEYANAVYAARGNNNIYITGKSKITGNICSYNGTDKVSIESGSKLVGGITGFEVVELIVNDAATAKQALWDVTDDFENELDLDSWDRDFDCGCCIFIA